MELLDTVQLPRYEVAGPADAAAVVVLGGISATRHVTSTPAHPGAGWWQPVVGPSRAVDTTRHRVIGVDYLDGGTDDEGRPARIVTTDDQADAIALLLDALGIERLHAFIGASYGGMVALAFAARHPHRLERLIAISASHEAHPMTTALRVVQRRIVELGLATGRERETLSLARALAMTTYRSRREFGQRFDGAASAVDAATAVFPVESYLDRHGGRFAAVWQPARFLALSLSADLHRVDPAQISTPTLLVAAEDDAIVPREQIDALAARIAAPARIADVLSVTGHDAFLTEPEQIGSILHAALTCPEFP